MIRIFGPGISGLACGIGLLKMGIEHEIIGIPNLYYGGNCECQGICVRKGRDLFASRGMLPAEFGLNPIQTARKVIIGVGRREFRMRFRAEIFLRGSHRQSLDSQLLKKYRELGGKITMKRFSGGDLKGETLVAADGYRSMICRKFGVNRESGVGGAGICIARGDFDTNLAYALFNKEISGYGYSYVLPLSESQATVAVCLLGPDNLDRRLEKFKALAWERFDIKSFSRMHTGFERFVKSPIPYLKNGKQEIYFTGDSASANEMLGGFGISNALASGHYCALSLAGRNPKIYMQRFREIQAKNKRNIRLRRVFEALGMGFLSMNLKLMGKLL